MKGHDRYESLAGAIALGEATPRERERFALHARACAACRADLDEPSPLAALARAREGERWQPSLERGVLSHGREARSRRAKITIGALAWAAGLSIVANVAFVTGLSSGIADLLGTPPAMPIVRAQLAHIEPPPMRIAPPITRAVAMRPLPHIAPPSHRALRTSRAWARVAATHRALVTPPLAAVSAADPIADILRPATSEHRSVAVVTSLDAAAIAAP